MKIQIRPDEGFQGQIQECGFNRVISCSSSEAADRIELMRLEMCKWGRIVVLAPFLICGLNVERVSI